MSKPEGLPIPPPAVVREHLARNLRENRLLRALLRVSERAAEDAAARIRLPDDVEAERHPIAWFSALLRGVDQRDGRLIDEARRRLVGLGYEVNVRPCSPPGDGDASADRMHA